MTNEKDLSSVDFESPEFKANIKKLIKEATWDKGGPMSYVDDEGWIVRHWEDGRIEKIHDTNNPTSKDRFNDIINKYKTQRTVIEFQEEPTSGYRMRTIKNAAADATIAFATDFTTSGEKLTYNATIDQGKKYIPINVYEDLSISPSMIDSVVNQLNSIDNIENNEIALNIAGNGIYTMKGKYTQDEVDEFTYRFLLGVTHSPELKLKISLLRSGGQTGFDEAGIKAAVKLGIPALILAPKGWGFRDMGGVDKYDEKEFKKRFDTI